MSEREQLLRAILENPAEDTVRLAFADWCDENGEPERAAFIRVQCRIEREPSFAAPEADPLRRREAALWKKLGREFVLGDRWLGVYGTGRVLWGEEGDHVDNMIRAEVLRGFVAAISCPTDVFEEHAEAIFRAHPVERVVLTGKRPYIATPTLFLWYSTSRATGQDADEVPYPLYSSEVMKPHRTERAALDALSDACVAWGRERAGLPAVDICRVSC